LLLHKHILSLLSPGVDTDSQRGRDSKDRCARDPMLWLRDVPGAMER
jgi:hypothetical protein